MNNTQGYTLTVPILPELTQNPGPYLPLCGLWIALGVVYATIRYPSWYHLPKACFRFMGPPVRFAGGLVSAVLTSPLLHVGVLTTIAAGWGVAISDKLADLPESGMPLMSFLSVVVGIPSFGVLVGRWWYTHRPRSRFLRTLKQSPLIDRESFVVVGSGSLTSVYVVLKNHRSDAGGWAVLEAVGKALGYTMQRMPPSYVSSPYNVYDLYDYARRYYVKLMLPISDEADAKFQAAIAVLEEAAKKAA